MAPHLFAGDAVFVVIMMAAVYVRRFGPRGMALGMVAFISYFFALFLHADIAQLPALAVAVVVGVACSLLMRNVVVRDRPERELARLLRAFRARLGAVVSAAAEGLVGGSLTPRSQRRLQHLQTRLNDAALMVEDRIDDGATGEPARWVFDAELATERLARLTVQVLDLDPPVPAGDRHRLADVLRQLRVALRTERPAGLDDRVRSLAEQLADATPLDGAVVDRRRMLGTVGGVVAGVLVAVLVGNHRTSSLGLIGVCIFFAFYLMQVSPAFMMFWITTMLALLYGLLGQFSVGLLLVRLEETAAGAAIGIVVAYLVLPTSTRSTVGGNARTVLNGVGELLCHAVASLLGDADGARLVGEARERGDDVHTLRSSAKPLTDGLAGIAGRSGVRHGLRVLLACDHYARGLARLCAVPVSDPAALRPGLGGATVLVRHNVDALAAAVADGDRSEEVTSAERLLDRVEDAVADCPRAERERVLAVLRHLRRIDQAVVGLAVDLGLPTAAERAAAS